MPIQIDQKITPLKLKPALERMFECSGQKILSIEKSWKPEKGTPVFTVKGRYTTRGWTEWTQGFQFGSANLHFDACGDETFLEIGRRKTVEQMASHVSHIGVHDHGFNNISTYGNLLRLMLEGRIPMNEGEKNFYELALKISGAVQASRWTKSAYGKGFIHSFNGPHSLFIDTIRSLRILGVAHKLGHVLMGEHDERINLLQRLIEHAALTADYGVYYGEGRDAYDICGRTAHESIFNVKDGHYRCPNSQQGYSPFSTWTRGLAWAICGYAEQLEFLETFSKKELVEFGGYKSIRDKWLKAAEATSDFYIANSCADGVPMWDTGAPELHKLGTRYLSKKSNPYNAHEPVDSSAGAIAAQGLIRLGNHLSNTGNKKKGGHYRQAGLTLARTLMTAPYLSEDTKHQGLLLHSIYHRPNGWDPIPRGQSIPCNESSMWGDYHLRELGLLILREARNEPYLTFYSCVSAN